MRLGFNTNGAIGIPLDSIARLLAELGYRSIAITLDHFALNPLDADHSAQARKMGRLLDRLGMHSVVETGARFLLDPRLKHQPTLVSSDPTERQWRLGFLKRAVELADTMRSDCVSLWGGVPAPGLDRTESHKLLVEGLIDITKFAERYRMPIGFEPEPGMIVARTEEYTELKRVVPHPLLKLTLDVGHVHCLNEGKIPDVIEAQRHELVNLHLEDMRVGVHEHLMFGEGELNFPGMAMALLDIGYTGGIHVELSRHGHAFPTVAREAMDFLRRSGFET